MSDKPTYYRIDEEQIPEDTPVGFMLASSVEGLIDVGVLVPVEGLIDSDNIDYEAAEDEYDNATRWRLSPEERVKLIIDAAVGKDNDAVST